MPKIKIYRAPGTSRRNKLSKKNISSFRCVPRIPNPFPILLFAFMIIVCFVFIFTGIVANEDDVERSQLIVETYHLPGANAYIRAEANSRMRPPSTIQALTTSSLMVETSTSTTTTTTTSTSTLLTASTSIITTVQPEQDIGPISNKHKQSKPEVPAINTIDQVQGFSRIFAICQWQIPLSIE